MNKYEVIYTLRIQVNAHDDEEAHDFADSELDELIEDVEGTSHYYLRGELLKEPRVINKLEKL